MDRRVPMKTRIALVALAVMWIGGTGGAAAQQAQSSVPDQLKVTIDTRQTAAPISKYIYGQFIEHIGSTMYSSVWAEMLDDRKFYFPITAAEPKPAARQQGGPFRMRLRKW